MELGIAPAAPTACCSQAPEGICSRCSHCNWVGFSLQLLHPAEVNLGLHIVRFPEALKEMLSDIYPNRITDYVYELSEFFSTFYNECQVRERDNAQQQRFPCSARTRRVFDLSSSVPGAGGGQ